MFILSPGGVDSKFEARDDTALQLSGKIYLVVRKFTYVNFDIIGPRH